MFSMIRLDLGNNEYCYINRDMVVSISPGVGFNNGVKSTGTQVRTVNGDGYFFVPLTVDEVKRLFCGEQDFETTGECEMPIEKWWENV